jgi:hypothetical protein
MQNEKQPQILRVSFPQNTRKTSLRMTNQLLGQLRAQKGRRAC